MAQLVANSTWEIQGTTVTLPVTITDAQSSAALFLAAPDAAASHLRGTELTPYTVGGRAVSVLMLVKYGEWVLGTYDEVGVGLLVHGPGLRMGLHLLDLPVTGEFTREAGQDLWGLPKWLMSAELTFEGRSASVTVADGDTFVMRATLTAGRLPLLLPARTTVPVWSRLGHGAQAGRLLRGSMPLAVRGGSAGRGSAHVELGIHPMALRMADLGMAGRPLAVVHARHMTGRLDTFAEVGG
jgi:hypothetical protein